MIGILGLWYIGLAFQGRTMDLWRNSALSLVVFEAARGNGWAVLVTLGDP